MDVRAVGRVFEKLNPPVWVVTAADADSRSGLVATFVSQASIVDDCPRVVVGIGIQHYTGELIRRSGLFGLHWLDESETDIGFRFAIGSGRDRDKFSGLEVDSSHLGIPRIVAAAAWLACRVEAHFEIGDRILFLGQVFEGGQTREAVPLRVKTLFPHATAEQMRELDANFADDARADRELIEKWRAGRGAAGPA